MAANVTLTGFPPVVACKFFQGSTEVPGRAVVDCSVTQETDTPKTTTMTMNARNFAGTWEKMRVGKVRVRHGVMRVVLLDSRWILAEREHSSNYNDRDLSGTVMSGSDRSISQLVTEIGSLSGLSINTAAVPSFRPPARWAGKRCSASMKELLYWTGCRMVYDPITKIYTVSSCGSGTPIDVSDRLLTEGPASTVRYFNLNSYPSVQEDRVPVEAKQINATTGAIEPLSIDHLGLDPDADYAQGAFRLWGITAVTTPGGLTPDDIVVLDQRGKGITNDPMKPRPEGPRFYPDDWDQYPKQYPFASTTQKTVRKNMDKTGGGKLFITNNAWLMRDSGGSELVKEAEILISYHAKGGDGKLFRLWFTVDVGGTGTEQLEVEADWIRPVASTETGETGATWTALLEDVSKAMSNVYKKPGQNVRLGNPRPTGGSGHVGGVEYELTTGQNRRRISMTFALNFIPGSQGELR